MRRNTMSNIELGEFTNGDIKAAIQQQDDPDHPDAVTVAEVREVLTEIQRDHELFWDDHMDVLEDGTYTLVAETRESIVLSVPFGESLYISIKEAGVDDEILRDVIVNVMHRAAERLTDYNWGTRDPLVIAKPAGTNAGERLAQATIEWAVSEGCTPSQALDWYMTEHGRYSQNQWAAKRGKDQSTVSGNVNEARGKIVA